MKPLLYYAALNHGFTPATMLKSEPTVFRPGGSSYRPHNFNSQYANRDITMMQALAVSDNIYAVKTHLLLGQDVLVQTAKQFGLTTPMEKVPSLALGTSGVHLLDMVNAYSLLANGGTQNGLFSSQKWKIIKAASCMHTTNTRKNGCWTKRRRLSPRK